MVEVLTKLGDGGSIYPTAHGRTGWNRWQMGGAISGFAMLSACVSGRAATAPGHGICRSSAAKMLVGKVAPDDAAILRHVGGSLVRRIAPGDATTKDFRENRVTVTIDSNGRIVDASCG